jgi:alkyl sulfatase BDS1-like metallo-beta-lactamase superfamily hydrolase
MTAITSRHLKSWENKREVRGMAYAYNEERKEATEITKKINDEIASNWDEAKFETELRDVENAKKHLIFELKNENLYDENGGLIYDAKKHPLRKSGERPDTVNPYLWQIRRDNEFAGVYKMSEGYYVLTGVEIALMGFIKGNKGWIIVDSGAYTESAEIAARIVEYAIGEKILGNVSAVIYSHTHWDHFGGAGAFVSVETAGRAEEGKIPVIGPSEYEQSLVDDNLYAGVAMSRRLTYQGGLGLPNDEKGMVSAGLNSSLGIRGEVAVVMPTIEIDKEQTLDVDGVSLTFIPTPNTETRAHMCVYSNTHKVLFLGDNAMGTVHNTYTPRGARVRDASFWGGVFHYLYTEFGDDVIAIFAGHGIAHFRYENGENNLKKYLLDNAVAYKFPSDQALLLANKGVKLSDVGRRINIPDDISKVWYTRDHYGNFTFNARGAVQRYLGFYDGNPVNLFPLESGEYAKKLIEYLGTPDEVLKKAEVDFEKGEYQWVATITNQLVVNDPDNKKARFLCADALEQLGYQTETGLWRNMYLLGAKELRNPEAAEKSPIRMMENREVMPYVSASLLLDYIGINFDGEKGFSARREFVLKIKDTDELYLVDIYKGTVLHSPIECNEIPENIPVLRLTKKNLYDIATKSFASSSGEFSDEEKEIIDIFDRYITDLSKYKNFNIIEPIKEL